MEIAGTRNEFSGTLELYFWHLATMGCTIKTSKLFTVTDPRASQLTYWLFYLRHTTRRKVSTFTVLKKCTHRATVSGDLPVHKYGKNCRKFPPCSTVLENYTYFKKRKATVYDSDSLDRTHFTLRVLTWRAASRHYTCASMSFSRVLLWKEEVQREL